MSIEANLITPRFAQLGHGATPDSQSLIAEQSAFEARSFENGAWKGSLGLGRDPSRSRSACTLTTARHPEQVGLIGLGYVSHKLPATHPRGIAGIRGALRGSARI